ncbi:hypothetical protein PV08_11452 [Exophiala spinifera]|uniref:Uncharacterized protein n=1 Tax=Exophiala spinifera TaxID=91928 RepID=A0A0D2AUU1_9EURO|nr:uncharacterized protein PV08_11452 [Exophiala spinifera]KIW10488.1 hypothetical protein PV08_11452 [Exophiala spinifera]
MAANPVVLILGSGPRVGAAVAAKFFSSGYKVAVASRGGTGTKNSDGYLSLKADFANPASIPALFDAVKAEFQAAPTVVVYNAAALTPPPVQDNIFSIPVETVTKDLNINTVSPWVAAQQAVSAWATLPKGTKKTFIYTGNGLNTTVIPVPLMVDLGVGKSASAYWLGTADALYSSQGIRFFYTDERFEDGKVKGQELDGPAHADFYAQLASHPDNVPWLTTFVKDKGYVQFK